MEQAKNAIIFDLGGVLVDWDPRYLYRKLFADEATMEQFLSTVCTPDWNLQQDAGRPFAEAVADLTAKHPEHAKLISAFHLRWEETLGGPIAGTVEILREVRSAGYQTAALSNWSAETFPVARRRYEFLNWFEVVVLSGEEKLIKPDPRIFDVLLRRIERRAEECLFIDDVAKNIAAAEGLGFQTIHFQSPAKLREELRRREILPAK